MEAWDPFCCNWQKFNNRTKPLQSAVCRAAHWLTCRSSWTKLVTARQWPLLPARQHNKDTHLQTAAVHDTTLGWPETNYCKEKEITLGTRVDMRKIIACCSDISCSIVAGKAGPAGSFCIYYLVQCLVQFVCVLLHVCFPRVIRANHYPVTVLSTIVYVTGPDGSIELLLNIRYWSVSKLTRWKRKRKTICKRLKKCTFF